MGFFNKLFDGFKTKSSTFAQMIGLDSFREIRWSKTEQMQVYSKSAYVYACVRLRAEKVGMVDFTLRRGDNQLPDHDILKLLQRPNQFQSKEEFFENYQMHKDLTGSVFVLMLRNGSGKVEELHLLRPDSVKIKMDPLGTEIVAFEYHSPKGKKVNYPPEDVMFSLSPSPFSPLIGHSPIKSGQTVVDTELQLAQYQNNVLKNGGKVEGILHFKVDRLTEEQTTRIKDQFAEHYSTAKNAGKPLVLYGDSKYQNLGLTPTEMSFLESKRMTRDDILLLYRVPKPLLAQTDDVNLASAKMAKTIFLSETIKPLLQNLVNGLNQFVVPEDLELDFVDPTPEDIDIELKKVESGLQNSYMTINEAREAQGREPIPEGDQILVPFSMTTLEVEHNREEVEEEVDEQEKSVSKIVSDVLAKSKPRHKVQHPLRDKEVRAKYAQHWIKVSDRREDSVIKQLNRYWRDQSKRLIEKIDAITPKNKRKGILDESWNVEVETAAAKEFILPMIRQFLIDSGQDTMNLVGTSNEFKLTSTLQTALEQKAEIFARSINETTFKRLQKEFVESIEEGESRRQLIKRIQNTYGDISEKRAETIARTEVTSASQLGVISGYEQSGIDLKIWVATPDGRTRDSHKNIDGEERPLNMPFSNGLQFPGDPSGPASETINCRCSI